MSYEVEVACVPGPAIRHAIIEQFGHGVMSVVDTSLIVRVEDQASMVGLVGTIHNLGLRIRSVHSGGVI